MDHGIVETCAHEYAECRRAVFCGTVASREQVSPEDTYAKRNRIASFVLYLIASESVQVARGKKDRLGSTVERDTKGERIERNREEGSGDVLGCRGAEGVDIIYR